MTKYTGLSTEDARKNLAKYGPNRLKDVSKASPFRILLRQVRGNLMVYLLTIASIISFFVGKDITGYAILAVLSLIVTISFIQEYRAEKAIQSLRSMLTQVTIVIRGGKEREIPSTEIVPGDIVILRSGDKVPADCIVIEQTELLVDESLLTGESKGQKKVPSKNGARHTDENFVFMGTFVTSGKCFAKVAHTGMNTRFGKIAKLISTAEKELTLQTKVNNITKTMAFVAIGVSIVTGALVLAMNPMSDELIISTLMLMIALSVSAFPEGFPVVLITTLSVGAHKMAKKNAIVNRMSAIETLGETTVICSDKTGTITKGEMTVRKIFSAGESLDVGGVGYEGHGEITHNGGKVSIEKKPYLRHLFNAAVLCNDANIERTGEDRIYRVLGAPTEGALLVLASKAGIHREDLDFERLEELPFSSERKMMSVLCTLGDKKFVFSKGAPEVILGKCKYMESKAGLRNLSAKSKEDALYAGREMSSASLRALAIAYKEVKSKTDEHLERDFTFLGIVGMEDPPRDGVKEAIQICHGAGIKVKMITGDHLATALSVADEIGLKGRVMEGYQLDEMTGEELSKVVGDIAIFARVKPEHKIKIVNALKMNGEIVTMTGDGVNDAPALKEAHIGVAMGKNGTDVSREVSDITLKDDNFITIVDAIEEGRVIFQNIRKFVGFQLSCNYGELAILFFGVLFAPLLGWQVPLLLALHILFMNLVTDDMPAITLGLTPASKGAMKAKPRANREILTKQLMKWIAIVGFFKAALVLGMFLLQFNILGNDFIYSRTVALVSLIFIEIADAQSFKSFTRKVGLRTLFVNHLQIYASVLSLVATALILYTPLNAIFEVAPLGINGIAMAACAGLLIVLIVNLLKGINNRHGFIDFEN